MNEKEEKYRLLLKQAQSLVADETNLIANLSNLSSLIHFTFDFWWTGFYFVDGKQLVLGLFQGPLACTRIAKGKGVCGTAWQKAQTIIVPDVDAFPGHIACSSLTKSEIVVPIINKGVVTAVLDIDSEKADNFDDTDKFYLEKIAVLFA